MNEIIAIREKVLVMAVMTAVLTTFLSGTAYAKLPEPDNIIYGLVKDDAVMVSLKVGGNQIASYTIGDNPNAGTFYVLRVPMDALDPAEPGTARPGNMATLFVNDQQAASLTLGERGTIQRLDLNFTNTDGDTLPDDWEQQIVDADPNDNIRTLADVRPEDDFDGDGESNWEEWQYGSSPIDAMSARCGDMDGDKFISLADAILALQLLCGVEPSVEVSTVGDVNGDGRIGPEDALYVTQKVSGSR